MNWAQMNQYDFYCCCSDMLQNNQLNQIVSQLEVNDILIEFLKENWVNIFQSDT